MIFTNDHGPPHVHVFKTGTEAVIELTPVAIRENYRMSRVDLRRAVDLVADNREVLIHAWSEMHGPQ
jgi:Domain of unknown function (DUF4160)